MAVKYKNNAASNLASDVTSSATSITITAGTQSAFPTLATPNDFFLEVMPQITPLPWPTQSGGS